MFKNTLRPASTLFLLSRNIHFPNPQSTLHFLPASRLFSSAPRGMPSTDLLNDLNKTEDRLKGEIDVLKDNVKTLKDTLNNTEQKLNLLLTKVEEVKDYQKFRWRLVVAIVIIYFVLKHVSIGHSQPEAQKPKPSTRDFPSI